MIWIRSARRLRAADEVIKELTHGYETNLGRLWENGHELSGGQWQKIALARAFMHNAEVLIPDKLAAALDAEAGYEIFRRFRELMRGRIAVLISHRFSPCAWLTGSSFSLRGEFWKWGATRSCLPAAAHMRIGLSCRRKSIVEKSAARSLRRIHLAKPQLNSNPQEGKNPGKNRIKK